MKRIVCNASGENVASTVWLCQCALSRSTGLFAIGEAMNVINVNESGASLSFTYEELQVVSRALLVVGNRLSIADYSTRMGARRDEADHLLQDIRAAIALREQGGRVDEPDGSG